MAFLKVLVILLAACSPERGKDPQIIETAPKDKQKEAQAATLNTAAPSLPAPQITDLSIGFETLQNVKIPVLNYKSDNPSISIQYRACLPNQTDCVSGVLADPNPPIPLMKLPQGHFTFFYTACNIGNGGLCKPEASIEGDFQQDGNKNLAALLQAQDATYETFTGVALELYTLLGTIEASYNSCNDPAQLASITPTEVNLIKTLATMSWPDFSDLISTDGLTGSLYQLIGLEAKRGNASASSIANSSTQSGSSSSSKILTALSDFGLLYSTGTFLIASISFAKQVKTALDWKQFLAKNHTLTMTSPDKKETVKLKATDAAKGIFEATINGKIMMKSDGKPVMFYEDPYTRKIYYDSSAGTLPTLATGNVPALATGNVPALTTGNGTAVKSIKIPGGFTYNAGFLEAGPTEKGPKYFARTETGDYVVDTSGEPQVSENQYDKQYDKPYDKRLPNDPNGGGFLQKTFGSKYRALTILATGTGIAVALPSLVDSYRKILGFNLADAGTEPSASPCARVLQSLESYPALYIKAVGDFIELDNAKLNVSVALQ